MHQSAAGHIFSMTDCNVKMNSHRYKLKPVAKRQRIRKRVLSDVIAANEMLRSNDKTNMTLIPISITTFWSFSPAVSSGDGAEEFETEFIGISRPYLLRWKPSSSVSRDVTVGRCRRDTQRSTPGGYFH